MIKTYKEALKEATKRLISEEIFEAEMSAWYLLEHLTGFNKSQFIMKQEEQMSYEQFNKYQELVAMRASHVPLQYITGVQEFMGLSFAVNESVLIPRMDTEILVEEVLKVSKHKSVLDVCTGSGCIIISISALGEVKEAYASDISYEALETAKKNALANNVSINFIQSDMFKNIDKTFDIIVSNPPYIETQEIEHLMPEVKSYEPYSALDGDLDGLKFYRILASQAGQYLNKEGYLFLEIGYNQGEPVKELLEKNHFKDITIKKDLAGLDRVVIAKKSEQK